MAHESSQKAPLHDGVVSCEPFLSQGSPTVSCDASETGAIEGGSGYGNHDSAGVRDGGWGRADARYLAELAASAVDRHSGRGDRHVAAGRGEAKDAPVAQSRG